MKSVRDQVKKRNLDWMIAFNNPTPIEFFRFIQPTHKARAIEKYGKILNEAIRLCKVPNEQSKLKNIKETVNVRDQMFCLKHIWKAILLTSVFFSQNSAIQIGMCGY
jgi:hypothetical protein